MSQSIITPRPMRKRASERTSRPKMSPSFRPHQGAAGSFGEATVMEAAPDDRGGPVHGTPFVVPGTGQPQHIRSSNERQRQLPFWGGGRRSLVDVLVEDVPLPGGVAGLADRALD